MNVEKAFEPVPTRFLPSGIWVFLCDSKLGWQHHVDPRMSLGTQERPRNCWTYSPSFFRHRVREDVRLGRREDEVVLSVPVPSLFRMDGCFSGKI